MIREIDSLKLTYKENVMLIHSILSIWTSGSFDDKKIPKHLCLIIDSLANKYYSLQPIDDLLNFNDALLEIECSQIRHRRGLSINGATQGTDHLSIQENDKNHSGFIDITLVCKECGSDFTFTSEEQEFYFERGFQNEPQRCKICLDNRKAAARGPKAYFTTICKSCGNKVTLPFEPNADRPTYCSDCFAKNNIIKPQD